MAQVKHRTSVISLPMNDTIIETCILQIQWIWLVWDLSYSTSDLQTKLHSEQTIRNEKSHRLHWRVVQRTHIYHWDKTESYEQSKRKRWRSPRILVAGSRANLGRDSMLLLPSVREVFKETIESIHGGERRTVEEGWRREPLLERREPRFSILVFVPESG